MSNQERQPTRVGLTIGSTTRLNEFDFSKISLSLERDLAATENPLDGFRGIHALLSKALVELQVGPKTQQTGTGTPTLPTPKPAAAVPPVTKSKTLTPLENQPVPPGPTVSKLVTLQERLSQRLQDLEILDGFDGLTVKPKRFLGETWSEVNEVIRGLGGKWFKGAKPADGSWRIPK